MLHAYIMSCSFLVLSVLSVSPLSPFIRHLSSLLIEFSSSFGVRSNALRHQRVRVRCWHDPLVEKEDFG